MPVSVRSFWKGYLRLALVAIPVRLVTAEKSETTPKFHQIDRVSGQRIHYQKTVPGRGEVRKEDVVMGYEIEPSQFVLLADEELDAVRLESRHTIELSQFVDLQDIDPLYFSRPYYLLPDGDVAEEGYTVIRDALRARRKAAIGQLTLRGKENLVAIYADGDGLVLNLLRYDSELKDIDEVFSDLHETRTQPDMLAMAEQLIDSRSQPFEPARFKNHYAEALRDLVQSKLSTGKTVQVGEGGGAGAKVIDFMEALKRSLAGERAETAATAEEPKRAEKAPAARPKRTPPSRGKGAAKAPAKSPARKRRG
ncbi:MAG: Ku protein [Hyphomicrobiales bacterium]|nr:Ku protein [Hyphomicrobiales bacterium]MBV8663869.1 Ku protein [Hyphomicrobiales bacterium]